MQRLLFGIVLGVAIVAVLVMNVRPFNDGSASAVGPTPEKIANNGPLGGLLDILVTAPGSDETGTGLFYCIGKQDHEVVGSVGDSSPDLIKTNVQCNATIPGFGESGQSPPTVGYTVNEAPAFPAAGPPPPPPYAIDEPMKGYGFYYHDGADPKGLCATYGTPGDPCTVTVTCFDDVGAPLGAGPNIITVNVIFADATLLSLSHGLALYYLNENDASCKAAAFGDPNAPKGPLWIDPLPVHTWLVAEKDGTLTGLKAPWRPSGLPGSTDLNFDGDQCTDMQELDKTHAFKCGDDPQNPSDSFAPGSDLSGIYDLSFRARPGEGVTGLEFTSADCGNPCSDPAQWIASTYFNCRADIQHNTGNNEIDVRAYCYTDSPSVLVNEEGYPGIFGDGFAGGPPPGPFGAFGDVDIQHSQLFGTYNKATNNFEIAGCFVDWDGFGGLGHIYIEAVVSAHQLPGTALIWADQDQADCEAGNPVDLFPGFSNMPWAFDLSIVQPNPDKGKNYDQDADGISTAAELQDNSACGLRDPYNGFDYYDVSIPRDGIVDLFNDIVGVINNYEPVGYTSGDAANVGAGAMNNYDRPSPMIGGVGPWNRGQPDLKIDLFNDIVGVIGQYNPVGCGGFGNTIIIAPPPATTPPPTTPPATTPPPTTPPPTTPPPTTPPPTTPPPTTPPPGTGTPVESTSTPIGPAGGSIDTGTGDAVEVAIAVPAGALPVVEQITINVYNIAEVPVPTGDAVFFSRAFAFEPDGLTFSTPATAVISYFQSEIMEGVDEATLDIMVYSHSTGLWGVAEVIARDTAANTITIALDHFSHHIPSGRDADGDGCPNEYEIRLDETIGGRRNMINGNDFYDVLGPDGGPPDHQVDLFNDITGVLEHYAPSGLEPEYDIAFDRGPVPTVDPPPDDWDAWDMTAPDGVIDLFNDVAGVLAQFGHDCR